MSIQDGGPAFPVAEYDHMVFQPATVSETKRDLSGMSLRDYFAAKAMQGWTANPLPNDSSIKNVAEWAYRQADAMLAARSA
ncbi:hypothetical protein QIT80_gp27 (endogenous virus) [Pseudomonas phage phiAH14a]|uniref:Uncharacterized protein n=1 Tax=Pseudomonas phage phiAH14a TaxID=1805958 RepID=A0A1B0VMC0_9CAUD|nr:MULTISPECIES: hypothetical protein [unclassified Pseudomonas]YP_010773044.1 hypothetical protein QIT80_gp27 [Pseudomonas phage phiAH14a]AMW64487.1 hypothetical protein AH14a_p27 [Pseudomonas phage phiAH14a]KAA0946685.1 hypothetical protein FQ182_13240 [Pseudomonas sp. ANT_H4]KAA0953214.1 hypothetical protein FQ186_06625 [Pseudomonas sp. ANT_H14]